MAHLYDGGENGRHYNTEGGDTITALCAWGV